MLTGESLPVEKKAGDEVFGATINKTGAFRFQATKGRQRYGFAANRQISAGRAGLETADCQTRRYDQRNFHADRHFALRLRRSSSGLSPPRRKSIYDGARQFRFRFDYRLPVRFGLGDADGDYGRNGKRARKTEF
jgi:hypothetical protein